MGVNNWCKESNHVFELGEFAEICNDFSLFSGFICKVVGRQKSMVDNKYHYNVTMWPNDNQTYYVDQDDLKQTNKKWEEKKYMKNFTYDDLKGGMRVVRRDGQIGILMPIKNDRFVMLKGLNGCWDYVDHKRYNSDLTHKADYFIDDPTPYDIMKVYDLCKGSALDSMVHIYPNDDLLWEREEAKEMTVAEIEKELGYSIKVVK